jgi:Predicted phosphotransferase related to Ser/Thr protein kinases
MQYKLQKIKSDASFREFFRLFKGKKTSIIVTSSKEKFKNLTAYSTINKFLRRNGIHTPKLISQHFNEGIIEIEDFGHKTLLEDVKKSKNKFIYYKRCIDVILKIQKIKPLRKIKIRSNKFLRLNLYNQSNLHKESDLFFKWYLPGIAGKRKLNKFKKKIRK